MLNTFKAFLQAIPALKKASAYRLAMRANVRALWNGTWDEFEFVDAMTNTVMSGLTAAWNEGVQSVKGVEENLSREERQALAALIDNELAQIDGFTDDILAGSKANKGLLAPLFARLDLWLSRYEQAFDMGALAGRAGDDNFIWVLGRTETHCSTCATLNGVVASKRAWDASGLRPRTPPNARLECGGWRCDCRLSATTQPATASGIPNV